MYTFSMKGKDVTVVEVTRPAELAAPESAAKHELFSSRPQAGFPAPGDADVERVLDINDLVVRHPASTFFVRVSGDSMEGAGIFEGDVLVIDRAVEASDGKIVVAAVNGELLVKRIKRSRSGIDLVSENPSYPPIPVGEDEDCYVWGVVVGSVRVF